MALSLEEVSILLVPLTALCIVDIRFDAMSCPEEDLPLSFDAPYISIDLYKDVMVPIDGPALSIVGQ